MHGFEANLHNKKCCANLCSALISLPVFHEPELFALVHAIANDEH